jgi:hypothetical protein
LTQDPYFETVPATNLDGSPKNNGKTKKIKRRINPKIPKADAEVLTKVKRRAYRLDQAISFCGLKFGWSSIIGFVPALGDFIDVFMALMVMNTAMKVSPGKDRDKLRATMIMNIAIDFAVGLVPFLGDVADALFRANTRNAVALEKMLNNRVKILEGKKAGDGSHHTGLDDDSDDEQHAHVYVEDASPPSYESGYEDRRERMQVPVTVQKPEKTKSTTRGGGRWFTSRPKVETDLEGGEAGQPPMPPRK